MKIFDKIKKLDYIDIFIIFVFGSLLFTIIFNIFQNGTYLRNDFRSFMNIEDHARHVIGMTDKNNYPNFDLVFPPFSYLIYILFLKSDTTILPTMTYYDISLDTYHIYYFVILFEILIFAVLLLEIFKKENIIKKTLLMISILLSYPIYYATILKGNNVFFVTMILLMSMILVDRDEDNILYLWITVFTIAISFGLKIIPAVFGLELIRRKKYKYAIITIILGLLIFFIPFWYFDGVETIKRYIDVLSIQNMVEPAKTGIYFYINVVTEKILNINIFEKNYFTKIIQIVFLLVNIFMYFTAKKHWQRMMILCFVCYALLPRSFIYYLTYYTIGLVFFLKDENARITKSNINNNIFLTFFILLFMLYLMHFTEGIHFVVSIVLMVLIYMDIILENKIVI